jgi:hypothetical protein
MIMKMKGNRNRHDADDVDPDLRALGKTARDHVDAHVLLAHHGVAGGQQEDGGEQVPLDFQERVGADVEGLADHRVRGADQHGRQHEPGDPATDELGEAVDASGQG